MHSIMYHRIFMEWNGDRLDSGMSGTSSVTVDHGDKMTNNSSFTLYQLRGREGVRI